MKPLWHYTVGARLEAILDSGELRPATAHVPQHEKPVVWCSLNQEWEETANKCFVDEDGKMEFGNKQATHDFAGGLIRIRVPHELAPLTWFQYKEESGIKPKDAKGLYSVAVKLNMKPGEWRASFDPIPLDECLGFEFWDGARWNLIPDGEIRNHIPAED